MTNEEQLLIAIKADTTNLMSGLKTAGAGVSDFSKKISGIGKGMTIAGAAILTGFGMAIKTASKFEQSMANTASVASATGEELEKMSDYAREMGEQSVFSASQAADAMYYLASAGMDTEEIMGALEGTLALAAATASDLSYTSASVAASLSQFSLDASEAGRIANIFAAGISNSQATMEKLTTSMSYVGPMAYSMGMEIEDTTGILMGLYDAGIDGSKAGTALRMSFVKLIDPTKEGTAALENLEVAIKDSEGEMRPFKDIIDDLGVAGMSTADAMAIFGVRAGPAMMALVNQGTGAIQKNVDAVTDTEKAMEMAAIQVDTVQGAIKFLRSAFEELQLTLVYDIMPSLKEFILKVVEVVRNISAWAKENKPLVENIVKWAVGLGVVLAILGPILIILPGLIAGVQLLAGAFVPFLVTGAIIAGIIKLNSLLDDMNEKVYKAQIDLNNLSLAEIDAEIESLAQEIKRLEEQIRITSELPLSSSAQFGSLIDTKNAIMNLEMKMGLLIERREELTTAEEKGIDVDEEKLKLDKELTKIKKEIAKEMEKAEKALKEKIKTTEALNAVKKIENEIYELTHTAMEVSIRDLDLLKQEYIDLGIEIEVVNRWYNLKIKKLEELNKKLEETTPYIFRCGQAFLRMGEDVEVLGDALDFLKKKATPFKDAFLAVFDTLEIDIGNTVQSIVGYLENDLSNALYNLLSGKDEIEWSWKSFWGGLKDILIQAVAAMIAKLVILASFSWLFGLLGLPLAWLGLNKGGGVGYNLGGNVKGFASGGGTDTSPAMLTPGEYVISKPMTDFIKKFKAIPSTLTAAIVDGLPTPTPAFAGGGLVGNYGIEHSEIKIYIDIHDNRIADDVDIEYLADTIGNEILTKVNQNRRH